MDVDTQIIPLAKLYLYISAPSLIFYSLDQAYSSFLRANKKMIQPTIISFATNISNIIISAIVIWGIPDLSIEEKKASKLVSDTGKMARIVSFIMSIIVLVIAFPVFSALMQSAVDNPTINVNNVDSIYCGLTAVYCLLINVVLEQGRATNLVYVKGLVRNCRRYCFSSNKFDFSIMDFNSWCFSPPLPCV